MDRVWQWAWDRYGPRYSWAVLVLGVVPMVPIWVLPACLIVGFEGSDRFLAAAAIAVAIGLAAVLGLTVSGSRLWRVVERWAAGDLIDRRVVLEVTYTLGRTMVPRSLVAYFLGGGLMSAIVGAFAGASTSHLIQYGIFGAALFAALAASGIHQYSEAYLRPVRAAVAGDSEFGDALPRPRPSFAAWSSWSVLAIAWIYTCEGAMLAAVIAPARVDPAVAVVIAASLVLIFAVPMAVGAVFVPALRPIRDLTAGTERVAAGDYSQRLPVVQDDDLGALAASFNRMQAGLAERERLHAAFGSYVDPALAEKLLAEGSHTFDGEAVEVTVFFADVRGFTAYSESHTPEESVALLNELFAITVPILLEHSGHANKFLGDGLLAVFGVPNKIDDHADLAVDAAISIQHRVHRHFGGDLHIGIGVNTGPVIAGTIGGGGKLEFTLIGDTVNVAARIEELTKTTGDAILIADATLHRLSRPATALSRGTFDIRGRDEKVALHALTPW
jgi:adenylate cyclase